MTRPTAVSVYCIWHPRCEAAPALARATYDAPDYEAYSEILERPLFTEGRTPPPEQAATESAAATPKKITPLNLRLEGIALTPEARVAVIRDLASKKMHRLSEGDKHQGWMVESIHATGATLKLGEQTEELTLELDAKSVGKTPVSASAPFRRNLNRRKK